MSPDLLSSIPDIRRTTQSLAMLDAILCPDWDCRYYSFNRDWGAGQEMASMRNGSGDHWFILFDATGAALKGYAHELIKDAQLAQRIQCEVPKDFSGFLSEPAFTMQDVTFCYWRRASDSSWSKISSAQSEDGSDKMLALLTSGPSGYKEWAENYFEVPVDLQSVSTVFAHQPLTESLVLALQPGSDLHFANEQAQEIGYPSRVS